MFSDWCVSIMSDISEMFLETCKEVSLCFADILFFATCAFQEIDDIVGLTIDVFCKFVLPVVLRQFVSSFDKFAGLAVLLFAKLLWVWCGLWGVRF